MVGARHELHQVQRAPSTLTPHSPSHSRRPLIILGDVFMRKYYTVFNYSTQTVSLALAA